MPAKARSPGRMITDEPFVRVVTDPEGTARRAFAWMHTAARSARPELLGLASGLAVATAFEPFAWAAAMPIGLMGLAAVVRDATPTAAVRTATLFGLGFLGLLSWWLVESVGFGAWLAVVGVQSLWFGGLGAALFVVVRMPAWPLWFAACWTTVEAVRSTWPLGGYPWGRLAFASIDTPFAVLLPLLGTAGVSFSIALSAALALAMVSGQAGRAAVARALVPAAGVAVVGIPLAPAVPAADRPPTTVAVVQGDVPGAGNEIAPYHRTVTRSLRDETIRLAREIDAGKVAAPDVVVWPENSTAVDPFRDEIARRQIDQASAAVGSPLLVGAIVDGNDPRTVLNQTILWGTASRPGTRYTKAHPVPFGEYVPFRSLLGSIGGLDTRIPRDMRPGLTSQPPLVANGLQIAAAICFDVAFDDAIDAQVRDGADIVTVQTSNATFINTRQIEQQFAISRVRAAVTGRSVVVASPNGISGVIGPDGRVIARATPRTTQVIVAEAPVSRTVTVATRAGDWIEIAVDVLAGASLGAGLLVWKRRRTETSAQA